MIFGCFSVGSCGANSTFFDTLAECVPNSVAALPTFASAITGLLKCPGGTISTKTQLESLRFCYEITGPLILTVNDASEYDFYALYDIDSVHGMHNDDLS